MVLLLILPLNSKGYEMAHDDFDFWKWFIAGMFSVGSGIAAGIWTAASKTSKFVAKQESLEAEMVEVKDSIEKLQENGCFSKMQCVEQQKSCQERTWDKVMLALEKRDREFDRKFSQICQGIGEIKARLGQNQ